MILKEASEKGACNHYGWRIALGCFGSWVTVISGALALAFMDYTAMDCISLLTTSSFFCRTTDLGAGAVK